MALFSLLSPGQCTQHISQFGLLAGVTNWLPADTTKHHQRVKYDFNSSLFLQYNGSLNLIHKCHIAFMMPKITAFSPSGLVSHLYEPDFLDNKPA